MSPEHRLIARPALGAAEPGLGLHRIASPLIGVSLACGLLQASPVRAEPTAEPIALETVVVTARKREENLQGTPISITAMGGESLKERQITSTQGLDQIAPNLIISQGQGVSGNSSAGAFFIRGVGQIDFLLNTDPGVGVYLDGVYVARSFGSLMDIVDLERVEVLRGPQGTLFGRNTIGGAISLVSKAPSNSFTAEVEGTVGSFDRHEARATFSGPISDTLSATGAVLWRERTGWVKRVTDGSTLGDDRSVSARGALRWTPRDDVRFDLAIDYTDEKGTSAPANVVQVVETASFPSFHNGALVGPPCVPPPGSLSNPACFNSQWVAHDLYREQGAGPSGQKLRVFGASLNGAWELSPGLTVKSITGYRDTRAFGSRDGDHTPILIQNTVDTYAHQQFSQEFQVLGTGLDRRLNWIVGAYYFTEQGENLNFVTFPVVAIRSGGSVDNDNTAIFGQAAFDITERLSLTAGLRWTAETKRFLPDQIVLSDPTHAFPPGSVPGFRIVPFVRSSRSISETTPMVNLAYRWTDRLMTYATYSEGFKSGGFTQRIFPPLPAPPAFAPEFVASYETGFKFDSADHRFRLNGAAYYTDYSDLQVPVLVGVQPLTANAGGAEIQGLELEFDAAPTADLRINGGLGYTHARYTSLDAAVLATGVTRDKAFAQIPEWTGNLGVSYAIHPGFGGVFRPRIDLSYRSEAFMNAANTPALRQGAYTLLNASVGYESRDGRWGATLFGQNLTDETVITGGFADLTDQGYAEASVGRPREWGLTFKYRY
ncbi:MAG TPA: TonB-dependent receptor [Phenylobacterium sp.]|nr:TonB-dependent receptor [Phenylobacterium sp.]